VNRQSPAILGGITAHAPQLCGKKHMNRSICSRRQPLSRPLYQQEQGAVAAASSGLSAATTNTTVVVIPVVPMSSFRPNSIITTVPMPTTIAMPRGVKGKSER
jgi:hypothetical protein